MAEKLFDIVIIGGGPAGIAAGIYASRSMLKTLLIETGLLGGNIQNTHRIENYPGFPGGISAEELAGRLENHAGELGLETENASVEEVSIDGEIKVVRTDSGEVRAKALIVATGCNPNPLGVPGEEELRGRGVSYCATCDGPFFKDARVAVVGGGNAAIEESLYLTRVVRELTIIHRRDELRATGMLQEKAKADPKIKFLWDSKVERILGDDEVKGLEIKNLKTGKVNSIEVDGVFIYIGITPSTSFIRNLLELDEAGYIRVDRDLATNIPGIFAAGDVINPIYRQIVIAAGEGARAALAAERYLKEFKSPR